MDNSLQHKTFAAALEWYADHGVDEALSEGPVDRFAHNLSSPVGRGKSCDSGKSERQKKNEDSASSYASPLDSLPATGERKQGVPLLGASDVRAETVKLASEANSLEELERTIADFDGIALKKTATNLVFADGNPRARVMVVGEAPGADEDRQGKPFVGKSGQLLDRILRCIGLDRKADEPEKAVYISNVLNWRPPGNRTPSPGEIEASLPFIERHIQLVEPEILIFSGGVAAKSLLGSAQSVSRLRKIWHNYTPQTLEFEGKSIPALVTYHPSYLLRTPSQKKVVWADMLMVEEKLH